MGTTFSSIVLQSSRALPDLLVISTILVYMVRSFRLVRNVKGTSRRKRGDHCFVGTQTTLRRCSGGVNQAQTVQRVSRIVFSDNWPRHLPLMLVFLLLCLGVPVRLRDEFSKLRVTTQEFPVRTLFQFGDSGGGNSVPDGVLKPSNGFVPILCQRKGSCKFVD